MRNVTLEDVSKTVHDIIARDKHALDNIEFIVGISRGGLFPAMIASTKMIKPLVVAYIDKLDNVYFDRLEWIKDKKVLLVDDIVRTGKTLNKIKNLILTAGASNVLTLTPYYLSTAEGSAPNYGEIVSEDIIFPWDE